MINPQVGLDWLKAFLFLLIVLQLWNLTDLIVLDWFLLMTLRPRFMILPGTEGLPGYRDYRFHLVKFFRRLGLHHAAGRHPDLAGDGG